jgi:hypothetical protein
MREDSDSVGGGIKAPISCKQVRGTWPTQMSQASFSTGDSILNSR